MPRMPNIPIEELYPIYEDKIGKARKEGYSDQEILVHLQGYEKEARTEGYSRKEINQFLGRLPKESSQFTEGLISGAMLPLKALATPFVAGQEAIKDVGRFFQGKKPTFGEDIARLWNGEEVKGIYEDLAGQRLEETLKQKTPLGKTWYGASVADLVGAIEQAGEYMIDPLMIAPSIASKIAQTVPKTFRKYITKEMAADIKNIEKAEWAEKDMLRGLARQLENSKVGMPLLKPSEVSGVGLPPYYGGLKTKIGELPEGVTEVTPLEILRKQREEKLVENARKLRELAQEGKIGSPLLTPKEELSQRGLPPNYGGELVGKPSKPTSRIVTETLGDVEGGKALATKDKVDSGMRTGRDLLEHNKTITEPTPQPQLGAKAEVGEVAKEPYKGFNELISRNKHGGYVVEDTYITMGGEKIKIGDEIEMGFAGRPNNMPSPWKLVNAENYFSTVGHDNQVRLTVEASNGKQMTFDFAKYYSPHKAEVGKVAKESFDEYLAKINPEGKMLTEKERPTVYVDDLEGIEDGSKLVKKIGSLEIKTDGESFYAIKDKKTVGYISPLSDKEIDLMVAKEYQNQGIGTELLTEFRKKNPFYQTGGLTEGGLKTEKRVFNKAGAKPLEPLAGEARGLKQFEKAKNIAEDIIQRFPNEKINVFGSFAKLKRESLQTRKARNLLEITKTKPDLDIIVENSLISSHIKTNEKLIDFTNSKTKQYLPYGKIGNEAMKYYEIKGLNDVFFKVGDKYYEPTSAGLRWVIGGKEIFKDAKPIKQSLTDFYNKAKPEVGKPLEPLAGGVIDNPYPETHIIKKERFQEIAPDILKKISKKFNRGDQSAVLNASARIAMERGETQFVYPTSEGLQISKTPPPVFSENFFQVIPGKDGVTMRQITKAQAKPLEPLAGEAGKSPFVEAPNLSIDRVEAKKRPDGIWQLFYRGTRNEVFPGEKFQSATEARNYFKVEKAKPEGVKGGGTTLYSGIPTPELEKLIKNTITYAERAGQKAEDYLRSKGFSEQQIALFLRNMAVVAKKELQETSKKESNLFVAPVHAVDKKLPSDMQGTEILNYDSPVYKDSSGKIDISGLKKAAMAELKALGIVKDSAYKVVNDEQLGRLLEPVRKPYWVGVQYEKIVPQALKIVESQVLAENRRFILSKGFVDLAKQYFKIPTLSRQKVNKALHWGEANNIETIPDDILKKQFGLIPEEIEGYKGFRDSVNASWDHKIQLMKEAEPPTTEVKRWQQWNEGYQGLLKQRIPGYVPHEWYGKFNIVRYNKAGEVVTIDPFNTRYSARKHIMNIEKKEPLPPKLMRREEIPEGLYSGINADWTEALIKKSAQKAGLPESEVNEILRSFDVEMKSRGWSKHLIHRKGVGGYREDLNNPLIDYLNGYAGSVTKAEKVVEFRKLFTDMSPDKVRGLKDYMKKTIDYYLKPDSDAVNRRIKDVLFNFFLGGRLKQIPVQASQQLVSFTPMLSTITKGANRKLTKASMDLLRGKLSDEERMAFELVYQKYPEQMSSELTKELSGKKVYPGFDTIKTSADMARAILRKPIEFAEHTINRTPAFLTSFRVFKEQGATIEEAVDKSVKLIGQTHYLYGKANRAPLERGNFQTFLTFKSFMMNYLEEMAYLARHKELGAMARSAAAMTVLAGARGLPFAAVGIALYKNAFKESPETTLRKMAQEQGVKGAIGKVGTVGYVGMLDAFANIDASGSIGAGDLLFGNMDEVFEDPRKLISEIPKQIVGAPAGFVERGLTGAYELRRGNIRKGIEQLSPEVSRDPQVAYRMMTEGATTQEGHPIETEPGKVFKLTPFEAAQKGVMGLQSARYSRMMRERREIKDLIGDTNQLTDYYAHQLLKARDAKNREKWDRLQRELMKVNNDRRTMEIPPIIIKEEHIKNRKEADTVPKKWRQFDTKLRQAYR